MYLNARAHGIEGQLDDQRHSFRQHGHEEREDKFQLLVACDLVDQTRGVVHQILVEVDVDCGRYQGVRDSQGNASIKAAGLGFEGMD